MLQISLVKLTPLNAISRFRKTGIYPIDRHVFTDEMFAAALPTDLPVNRGAVTVVSVADEDNREYPPETENYLKPKNIVMEETRQTANRTPLSLISSSQPLCVASGAENKRSPQPSTSGLQNITVVTKTPPPSSSGIQNFYKKSDSKPELDSQDSQYFSPEVIKPYPKATQKSTNFTKRKTGKAAILTSTPYKDELSENIEKRRNKNIGTEKRNILKPKNKQKIKKTTKKAGKKAKFEKNVKDNTSSDEDEDPECLYCGNSFSSSKKGEGWIKCMQCSKWAHDACAGAEEEEENFLCDLCRY